MNKLFFQHLHLAISILVALGVVATEVPAWMIAFSFLLIIWRYGYEKFNFYKMPTIVTTVLAFIIFAIVYAQYKTIFGQLESTTLLMGLTAITIYNYSSEREHLFLVLLGFLMLVLKSVFSIDFVWLLPALVSFFGLWLSLISNDQVKKYNFVFKAFLRATPILAVLFILFPRIVLFQIERIQNSVTQSGFSEQINPGHLAQVKLSNETVFRAQFLNSENLAAADLYWRGAVLKTSKGFAWQKDATQRKTKFSVSDKAGQNINYKILLEPNSARNIFLLEQPIQVKSSTDAVVERDFKTYSLSSQPDKAVQYEAESSLKASDEKSDDPTDIEDYLQIQKLPPKTLAWVENIKSKYPDSLDSRLKELVQFFQDSGFEYTLSPDYYGNSLDQFLFTRRKGFCEHFAAAFGTLARGLEIPARLVIGYQGGQYNQISRFWKISQKDAHAWVEVGLHKKWLRIDPTGLVSPLRISLGGEEYFSLTDSERLDYVKNKNSNSKNIFRTLYNNLTLLGESLNYQWSMFLLNYDLNMQLDILKKVKLEWLYVFIAVILSFILVLYLIKKYREPRSQQHELHINMQQIEIWAQKQNLEFKTSTTPLQLLTLVKQRHPTLQPILDEFSQDYQKVVYQNGKSIKSSKMYKKEFKQNTKNL